MKILHINSYYSSSPFYKHLFDYQIKKNLDIDVYVPVSNKFEDTNREYGEYTKLIKNHRSIDRYFFHIKHGKILRDVKNQYSVDSYNVIHAHSLFSNGFIAYKLFKEYGVPYIVAVRDTDLNIFFGKMIHLRSLGIRIMHNAKKIIFLSSNYRNKTIKKYVPIDLQKEMIKKSLVIPKGIDPFWLNNKIKGKKKLNENTINILYAGRISKRKNIYTTVKACQILQSRGYKVKFTIVGKIEDQKEFDKINGYEFINYSNMQSKESLINFYRANDIFVMPSITETFGLVYAEAMSQGLPVIYTKGQGFDGQFDEGVVGYHVNCFDASNIADKVLEIIDNYETISQNCKDLVDKFNWEDISNLYIKIYQE